MLLKFLKNNWNVLSFGRLWECHWSLTLPHPSSGWGMQLPTVRHPTYPHPRPSQHSSYSTHQPRLKFLLQHLMASDTLNNAGKKNHLSVKKKKSPYPKWRKGSSLKFSLGSHFVFWVLLLRISLWGEGQREQQTKEKKISPPHFFFYTETTSFLHYLGWFPCNSWWPRISNLKLRTWQVSKSWPYFSNKISVFSKLTYEVFFNSSLLPPNKLPCWSSLNNMHKDFGFLRLSHWDFLLR